MKTLTRVMLLVVLPCLGFSFLGSGGPPAADAGAPFLAHDPEQGLRALQAGLNHPVQVLWNEANLTPAFVSGRLTSAGYASPATAAEAGARFLAEHKDLFGLKEPSRELRPISEFTDDLSMTHVKYQQYVGDVKVFHGQLIVHVNRDGSIESVNGRYFPTPVIDTTPVLSSSDAIAVAERAAGSTGVTERMAQLTIYARGVRMMLAYEVSLPSYATPRMTVFVDARTGDVVKIDNGIRYDGPAVGSGIAVSGATRTLHTYLAGGDYFMLDAALPMYVPPIDNLKGIIRTFDANNDTSGDGYNNVSLVTDPNKDNNFNDNARLPAAVDAHFFTRQVYEVYKSRFNRNSFDNAGGSYINIVHLMLNFNNAFWDGQKMNYGDGDGVRYSQLAGSLDVIAHEITHGVTTYSADLVYEVQPGALNESMSDVFAVMVDSTDWLLAEDIFTPGTPGDALRNMQDPHNGHGAREQDWQPAHMDEYWDLPNTPEGDNGGVHINSGIPNKAFYNVATSIGRSKAGLIWYRALTAYLTKNSQFVDARAACTQAAKDLFGDGSAEMTAVGAGFEAVGIGSGGGGQSVTLIYDDGDPATGVYETDANWELAVRFSPPTGNVEIKQVGIYLTGENNPSGNGSFTLKMYLANGSQGLPGTPMLSGAYTPTQTGWQVFDLTNANVAGDFYLSAAYDGVNEPLIGADNPPGNMRAFEYNGISWYQLTSPYDFTLFMRAVVQTMTGVVTMDSRVPQRLELLQNYPNPFNPATSIRYALPHAAQVNLVVYDMTGARVAALVDNVQEPGTYEATWNGKSDAGAGVASGVYLYRLEVGAGADRWVQVRKMVLMK